MNARTPGNASCPRAVRRRRAQHRRHHDPRVITAAGAGVSATTPGRGSGIGRRGSADHRGLEIAMRERIAARTQPPALRNARVARGLRELVAFRAVDSLRVRRRLRASVTYRQAITSLRQKPWQPRQFAVTIDAGVVAAFVIRQVNPRSRRRDASFAIHEPVPQRARHRSRRSRTRQRAWGRRCARVGQIARPEWRLRRWRWRIAAACTEDDGARTVCGLMRVGQWRFRADRRLARALARRSPRASRATSAPTRAAASRDRFTWRGASRLRPTRGRTSRAAATSRSMPARDGEFDDRVLPLGVMRSRSTAPRARQRSRATAATGQRAGSLTPRGRSRAACLAPPCRRVGPRPDAPPPFGRPRRAARGSSPVK